MRTLALAALESLLLVGSGNAADLTCPSSMTLDALVTCIRAQMPQAASNGYVAPTPSQRADWRILVNRMLRRHPGPEPPLADSSYVRCPYP